MRVVFDTNVLISALLWPERIPARAVALARHGYIRSITSPQLLDEFRRVLRERFEFEPDFAESAVEIIVEHSEIVKPGLTFQIVKADPDDDRVLECAFEGKADAIVTGDRHLLTLKSFKNIPIIVPREFLNHFHGT